MNSILWSLPDRARRRPIAGSRWRPTGCMRDSMSRNHATGKVPLPINPPQTREINLRDRPARPAALRHTRMVVTVRELDDLLREDVRRELEQLHHALPVYAIDINDPFLSSRLFGTGWDDPQMAGYACWYNLQQIFSWLAAMGWQVILHTGVTTRSDLLQRFLQLAANHFPPATLNSWRFVWHWSPQASEAARQAAWRQQRGVLHRLLPQPQLGIWHRFAPSDPGTIRCSTRRCWQRRIFSPARQMPTNSWIWPRQTAAAWPPANITRCTSCGRSTAPCASVSSTCRCGCSPEIR